MSTHLTLRTRRAKAFNDVQQRIIELYDKIDRFLTDYTPTPGLDPGDVEMLAMNWQDYDLLSAVAYSSGTNVNMLVLGSSSATDSDAPYPNLMLVSSVEVDKGELRTW